MFNKMFQEGFFNNEFVTIIVILCMIGGLTYFDKEIPSIISMIIGVVGKGIYDKNIGDKK